MILARTPQPPASLWFVVALRGVVLPEVACLAEHHRAAQAVVAAAVDVVERQLAGLTAALASVAGDLHRFSPSGGRELTALGFLREHLRQQILG